MQELKSRVGWERWFMLLRRPSPARYAACWVVAWCVLGSCLALDYFGYWTLANSASIGAQLRSKGSSVVVSSLEDGGAFEQSGGRVGQRVLAIGGRAVDSAGFVADPDDVASWSDRDLLWDWQRFLVSATSGSSISIVLEDGAGTRTILCPVRPMGWRKAALRGLSLRLAGWSFLLLAVLIWIKKPNETSLVNMIAGVCIFASLSTLAAYTVRDLCIPATALTALTLIDYLGSQAMIMSLHLGLIFPTPVRWLARYPWVRILPWCAYFVQMALNFGRVFPSPAPTVYVLSSISLLGFLLILVVRLLRTADPLARAQLQWVTLGAVIGFLPWVLLSAIPESMHLAPVPEHVTLLSAAAMPLCVSFAIFRYRLLDVDQFFDLVIFHLIFLGAFLLGELAFWNWLSLHFAAEATGKSLSLALSLSVAVLLYAPLRAWSLHGIRKLSGADRPSLAQSLHKLLERAQTTGDPSEALQQTLQWTLKPGDISWVYPSHEYDALLDRLRDEPDGLLGYELGEACPEQMQSAAWIPIQIDRALAALVLHPSGSRGWNRADLRIARTLARSGEPLFEMRNMQNSHLLTQTAMREQRDELMREMHDGLGSQLFGASLLSDVSEKMTRPELRERFEHVNAALSDAMDTLRTGLTVLGSPPGVLGPAILGLLMRSERVLEAAGIALETKIDDDAVSLQLDSRSVFSILRAVQEALTNIARHSHASQALVRLELRDNTLIILIRDHGAGFEPDESRSGHGLVNISRRMQMLGGRAIVTAAPNAGCTIELSLPLPIGAL
jgi:signal transduction histidine kinase